MSKRTQIVYTHLLRWEPLRVKNGSGRAWIKTLNIDPDTGARSALVKYAPGFRQETTTSELPVDIYVLEGEMESGNVNYKVGSYHYRPVGSKVGPTHTETGITRLILSGEEDKSKASKEPIFIADVDAMPFVPSYNNPNDPEKGGAKVLREDRAAGVSVLINAAFKPDLVLEGIAETHDHFEEVYTLAGEFEDYLAEVDGHILWVPGLYVYREANKSAHGDVVKYRLPQMTLIKRGWVGEVGKFFDSAFAKNLRHKLDPTEYSE